MRSLAVSAALLLLPVANGLLAQEWRKLLPTRQAAMAYDATRGRTVLFEDQRTWFYAGDRWTLQRTTAVPPAREYHAMAHDVARGRTVLFGGATSSGTLADTWEHDGSNWVQRNPPASPNRRWGHAMAYDVVRGRTVLFGGIASGSTEFADTWEWDGSIWQQRVTATVPHAREWHALAYDQQRHRTVLFGGSSLTIPGALMADTWEYDGSNWTQRFPATVPAVRQGHALAYDPVRARTLLFGGGDGNNAGADTWEYDGTNWTLRFPSTIPPVRQTHAMVYDVGRGRTVCHGGRGPGGWVADTWEYDGTTWARTVAPPLAIAAGHALAQDDVRARTVLFGGWRSGGRATAETWEFDGLRWTQVVTASGPPLRTGHGMAQDGTRGRTVLFGGFAGTPLADTWEFDGVAWQMIATPTAPPARQEHALAYDGARGRVVLFGGRTTYGTATGGLADTWEYDGTTWVLRNVPAAPPARHQHSMAYDAARGRCVLFGGLDANTNAPRNDTWCYDGSSWLQMVTANAPVPRRSAGIAFDGARGRVVLHGGLGGYGMGVPADTWEFDGGNWLAVSIPETSVYSPVMTYDNRRNRLVLVGSGETMEFVAAPVATIARYGLGCAGSAGIPVLDAAPGAVPGLGTTMPLQLGALPLPAGLAILALGFDRTQWSGSPLPMALDTAGMPGCRLWCPPEFWHLLATNGGTAGYSLAFPADPLLAGLTLGAQALSLDPAAVGGLGAVSNGVVLRLF